MARREPHHGGGRDHQGDHGEPMEDGMDHVEVGGFRLRLARTG